MKKILSCLTLCFCLLLSGVVFAACDKGGDRTISLNFDSSVVDVKLSCNGEELMQNDEGNFVVEDQSNIRVELFSKRFGYEFSNAKITVNNQKRTLVQNSKFDPIKQTDTKIGYFLLPRLSTNADIVIEGGQMMKTTFNFTANAISNTSVATKLKNLQISTDGTTYTNFHSFLTSENHSITRTIDDLSNQSNNYRTFFFKLDKTNLLDLSKTPFKVRLDQNQYQNVTNYVQEGDILSFNVGEIGSATSCTIIADFQDVPFAEYSLNLTQPNMCFDLTTNRTTVSYENSASLTLTKKLSDEFADYSSVVVKLDGQELKEITIPVGPMIEQNNTLQFEIPAGIVPADGKFEYDVTVEGIQFKAPTQNVTALSENQTVDVSSFITSFLSALDSNKNFLGALSTDAEGNQFALFGQYVQLDWTMLQEENEYLSPYDLLDFDVFLNGERLFNLKEVLTAEEFDPLNDTTLQISGDGYSLVAKYNLQTSTFDSFQLQVKCEGDICLTFQNFAEKAVEPQA